jgi:predicted oxidoreductase
MINNEKLAEREAQLTRSNEWSPDETSRKLSEIIDAVVEQGIGFFGSKSDVYKDCDIQEAIDDAIVLHGKDSEDAPCFHDMGNQFEFEY